MKKEVTICIIFLLISGIISCILGVDISWDFYSYHYYNAFAVLNNRIGFDIMPAGIQSYLNPVLDVIDYFVINAFRYNKYLVMFLLGLPYGCFAYLLYLINRKIFDKISTDNTVKKALTIFATVIGATECFVFSEVGTAYHDINIGVFILLALLFTLKYTETEKIKNLCFAGFLAGIACGLKFTFVPYFIALLITFILFNFKKDYKKLSCNVFLLIIFSALGFIITDGYWMYILWQKFQNPVFPMYNEIFKSEWYTPINYHDIRFANIDIFKILFYPLFWSDLIPNKVAEVSFFDLRHSFTYICIIFSVIWLTIKCKIKNNLSSCDKKFIYIAAFMVVSYLIWVKAFGLLRYFIPVLGFTGTIIVYILSQIKWVIKNKKNLLIILTAVFVLSFINYEIPAYGRGDSLIYVPKLSLEDDSIVFIYGKPLAFMAARKYKNTRFIYLYDNIDGPDEKFRPSEKYYDYIDSLAKNKQKYIIMSYNEYRKSDKFHDYINDRYIEPDIMCSNSTIYHYTHVLFCKYPNK